MLSFYLSMLETEEDRKTMTHIYEKYNKFCIYIANEILKNHDDAEDAAQAAFMEIIKKKDKCFAMAPLDLRAYLAATAKNKAIDIYRLRKKESATDYEITPDSKNENSSLEDLILTQEDYELLRKALKQIPIQYEDILALMYYEKLSYVEIGERLGITTKNVETRLYRARNSLREILLEMKGMK